VGRVGSCKSQPDRFLAAALIPHAIMQRKPGAGTQLTRGVRLGAARYGAAVDCRADAILCACGKSRGNRLPRSTLHWVAVWLGAVYARAGIPMETRRSSGRPLLSYPESSRALQVDVRGMRHSMNVWRRSDATQENASP